MASAKRKHQGTADGKRVFGGRRISACAKLTWGLLVVGVPVYAAPKPSCTEWAKSLNACSVDDYFPDVTFGPKRLFEVERGLFIEKESGLTWRMEGGACLTETKLVELGKELAQLRAENQELKQPGSIWLLVGVGVVLFGAGIGAGLVLKK